VSLSNTSPASVSAERLLWCIRHVEKAILILFGLVQPANCLCHWSNCSFIDDQIQSVVSSQRQTVPTNRSYTMHQNSTKMYSFLHFHLLLLDQTHYTGSQKYCSLFFWWLCQFEWIWSFLTADTTEVSRSRKIRQGQGHRPKNAKVNYRVNATVNPVFQSWFIFAIA